MDKYKETFETWDKVALLYQDRFMDLDLYNDTYDAFCDRVPARNAAILDIGCGPGNITKHLLHKRPDFKIEGNDISPNMIELAKANNPTASFDVMDCREIGRLPRRYDGIVCGFCLPYLSGMDSAKLIEDCGNLLGEKGVLYISFVEGEYSTSGFRTASSGDRVYFYFHELDRITQALQDNGFKVVEILKKRYKNTVETEEMHTIILAGK